MKIGNKIKEALKLPEVQKNIRTLKTMRYLYKNHPDTMEIYMYESRIADNQGCPIPCVTVALKELIHDNYCHVTGVNLKSLSSYKIS